MATVDPADPPLEVDSDVDSQSHSRSDAEPETDSIINQVEPFEAYQHRVLTLAQTVVWPDAAPDEITVERLGGGSYNRIIGITRHAGTVSEATRYILRIPWWHDEKTAVENEVAPIRYLQGHTDIPSPGVVMYDKTANNVLESPYVIQTRIPGHDLHRFLVGDSELNTAGHLRQITHEGWCALALGLGQIVRKLLSIRNNIAGRLLPDPSDANNILVAPFQKALKEEPQPVSLNPSSPPTETAASLLVGMFRYERARELDLDPDSFLTLMPDFEKMTTEISEAGFLDDIPVALCHLDLYPRNIIINFSDSEGATKGIPKLEAILDWDSAVFAPAFMICEPPVYLWNHKLYENGEEDGDCEDWHIDQTYGPVTEDDKEVKRIFEEAAGEEYMRFAYDPAYRLVRQLFRFGMKGIHSSWELRDGQKLLDFWQKIKKPKEIASRFTESMESVEINRRHETDHTTMEEAKSTDIGLKSWLKGVMEKIRRFINM
ncbi:hypothetical protein B0T21DRAFT_352552 [Apiosordaria backusii]|uniref:Aminoglycoside phosphotransferase domain-containing protein n=1 Tax=Apiosordaria backusii TaxID=314023 RepID=A0AA40AAI5_9PEZI|nr:hypothetical protein B0T21DRAFT_352552 [Apiosordaria backusii]